MGSPWKVVTNITRKKAANRANQSSDLRQNRRKPIPHHITAMITQKMVQKVAYPLAETPSARSAWSPLAVSAPAMLHSTGPIHALWSCAWYTGRPATKSATLGRTSANHTARARRSQEPDKRVFAVPAAIDPLAFCCCVFDCFMELSLSLKRFLFLCFYSIRKGEGCTGVQAGWVYEKGKRASRKV